MTKFKTSAIAALVAIATIGGAANSAQADANFGIHFDTDGNVGFYIGNAPAPIYDPHPGPGWGPKCTKGKALKKAKWKYKMKNTWVKKVTPTRVVVRGKRFGNPARLVLHRNTANCAVKKFHYI